MQNNSATHDRLQFIRRIATTWIVAYAQIYFSKRMLTGILFCAATFIVPQHGLFGLLGLLLADFFANLTKQPREHIEDGYYGFNGLLIGLALALIFQISWQSAIFLAVIVFLGVLAAAALRFLSQRYLGLPVLSLPFILAAWSALLAARRFLHIEMTLKPFFRAELGAGVLPAICDLYLRSLGAAFFQLSVLSGFLVFLGLLWFSRWATLLSILGFASGYSVYIAMGGNAFDLQTQLIGFNFILTAIAVGGIWIVLSPASMLYGAVGAALASVLSACFLALFQPYELPILAISFVLSTYLMLFAIIIRTGHGHLRLIHGDVDSPETNLSRTLYRTLRYPHPSIPVVFLPVSGQWTISQGPDGETTHRGLWSRAWDFEINDEEGRAFRNMGVSIEDYYAYQAPVFAPGDAKVVRVVDHIEDNPVGEVNTANNWGNLVILWHVGAIYSALCHLQKNSILVNEGDTVSAGQLLGRVGNSGRSPTPHLHFQLQASPDIGAPTIYAELLHYVTENGNGPLYVTHGSPGSGSHVAKLELDEMVRRSLSLAPGLKWTWSVERGKRRTRETWKSEIDPLGARYLKEDDQGRQAKLQFFSDDHYLTLFDYQGPSKRLLGLFYLGLPRIPYSSNELLKWGDHPDVSVFLPPVTKLVHELLLPFWDIIKVETISSMHLISEGVRVTTHIKVRSDLALGIGIPDYIEIDFSPGSGPVAMRSTRAKIPLVSAKVTG